LIDIEDLSDDELAALHERFRRLAEQTDELTTDSRAEFAAPSTRESVAR
jgi:hypothetical protein